MSFSKIKVAVLTGGPSRGHEISKKSANDILEGLDSSRYDSSRVFVDKKGFWEKSPKRLGDKFDVVMVAMHGNYGEGGVVQRKLEDVDIPYTGSGVHSSALGMNKFLSLNTLERNNLNSIPTLFVSRHKWKMERSSSLSFLLERLGSEMVVKPNRESLSVGVSFVSGREELEKSLDNLFGEYKGVVAQPKIKGREVSCGVLDMGTSKTSYPLEPVEITPNLSYFFDYNCKREMGGAEKRAPSRLPHAWIDDLKKKAKDAHDFLGCRGFSKTDMIISEGEVNILEVNTIPKLTESSLLLKGAKVMGISFPELLDKIIMSALLSESTQ